MRWSYKTIHYELRKEGLLGSSFIDEAEIEESLNEFGHAGWELISLIEAKDGLIGVLKQPLDKASDQHASAVEDFPVMTPKPHQTLEEEVQDSPEILDEFEIESYGESSEHEEYIYSEVVPEESEDIHYTEQRYKNVVEENQDDESYTEIKERNIGKIRIE